MGNRQISYYAFTYIPNTFNVYCDTTLSYESIQLKTLDLIRNDLSKSHSQLIHTYTDYILAAMAYIIRENSTIIPTNQYKEGQPLSYLFYKNGTLILKIVHKQPNVDLEHATYNHIQCNLDILFVSTK